MSFPVVAALRAVVKALWRVGDCEARVVRFPNEFGVSPACHRARPHLARQCAMAGGAGRQKRRYTERRGNRFGQHPLTIHHFGLAGPAGSGRQETSRFLEKAETQLKNDET
jgi:hypothetical protein